MLRTSAIQTHAATVDEDGWQCWSYCHQRRTCWFHGSSLGVAHNNDLFFLLWRIIVVGLKSIHECIKLNISPTVYGANGMRVHGERASLLSIPLKCRGSAYAQARHAYNDDDDRNSPARHTHCIDIHSFFYILNLVFAKESFQKVSTSASRKIGKTTPAIIFPHQFKSNAC